MAEIKMQLADWLDDLCVRFIINLPEEELESAERICFQVEEAQWFYEDFVRPLDPTLPSLNLRQFCLLMFQHCPLLAPFPEYQHVAAFDKFLAYKVRVPVRGAIMLDQNMEEVVLVKGWKKSANWSFPRGKINKDEDDLDCAIREVYEETGFDISAAGLVHDKQKQKHIDVTMREQHMKLFVFRGVPKDTVFIPRTRKEISKIQWYKLAELPGYHKNKVNKYGTSPETISSSKLYMVAPFMQPLKKWIALQRKAETLQLPQVVQDQLAADGLLTDQGEVADDGEFESTNPMHNQHIEIKPRTDELLPHLSVQQDELMSATTASQLKKLLNIGHSNHAAQIPPNAAPSDMTANKLLAILRQGLTPGGSEIPPQRPDFLKTSVGQISFDIPQANNPHHHQPLPPSMSNMPHPPVSPIPLRYTSASPNHDAHMTSSNVMNSRHYYNNHYPSMPIAQTTTPNQGPAMDFTGRNFTENDYLHYTNQQYSQHSEQKPRSYLASENLGHDILKQNWNSPIPLTPHVPEQPARNLSTHAQSLLNTLMAKGKPTPIAPLRAPQISTLPSSLLGFPSSIPSNTLLGPTQLGMNTDALSHGQGQLGQALANAADKSAVINIPSISGPGSHVVSPVTTKAGSQRDNLLSLFRSPPVGKTMVDIASSTSQGLQPSAFELSAVPSPRPHDRPLPLTLNATISAPSTLDIPLEQRAELSAMPSPTLLPQLLKRHAAMKLDENVAVMPDSFSKGQEKMALNEDVMLSRTSATLPGPPNVPDLGAVKRKHRAPKSPSLTVANVFDAPAQEENGTTRHTSRGIKTAYGRLEKSPHQQVHPPTPIQILKRPIINAPASPNQDKVLSATVNSPVVRKAPSTPTVPISPARVKTRSPKPPTPKLFQPQILRRPQPSPSIELSAHVPAINQPAQIPIDANSTTNPVTVAAPASSADRKQALLSLFSPPKTTASPVDYPRQFEEKLSTAENTTSSLVDMLRVRAPNSQSQSSSDNHTKTLLSLLNNNSNNFKSNSNPILPSVSPSAENPTIAPLMTTMPPLPLAAPLGTRMMNTRTPVPPDVTRSRLNSITSVPGSGTQTPISPSDRGFLMSYLRGL